MLSTSLDVMMDAQKRSAGIDRGRLHSPWLDCPYKVERSTYGFRWTAEFHTLDLDYNDPSAVKTFHGSATTRDRAARAALDTLTKHISNVVDARRQAQMPVVAKAQLATRNLGHSFRARLRRFVARILSWFSRSKQAT